MQGIYNSPGVVGHQPILPPGRFFEYCSFVSMPGSGSMSGNFQMARSDPEHALFEASIDPFALRAPQTAATAEDGTRMDAGGDEEGA